MNNNKFVGKVGIGEILTYVVLILVLIFTLMPLLFMVTAAFMDAKQIMSMPYTWIPSSKYFTTETRTFFTNFQKAILGNHGEKIFFRNLINSLVVPSPVRSLRSSWHPSAVTDLPSSTSAERPRSSWRL